MVWKLREVCRKGILGLPSPTCFAFRTTRGGMTSHAAVVARGMGRPCVAGAGEVKVNYSSASFEAMGLTGSRYSVEFRSVGFGV